MIISPGSNDWVSLHSHQLYMRIRESIQRVIPSHHPLATSLFFSSDWHPQPLLVTFLSLQFWGSETNNWMPSWELLKSGSGGELLVVGTWGRAALLRIKGPGGCQGWSHYRPEALSAPMNHELYCSSSQLEAIALAFYTHVNHSMAVGCPGQAGGIIVQARQLLSVRLTLWREQLWRINHQHSQLLRLCPVDR